MVSLAEAVYAILAERSRLSNPRLTYTGLVATLSARFPEYSALTPRDGQLAIALGDVGNQCRENGLPLLTAMVVSAGNHLPGDGYFKVFHPNIEDTASRTAAWQEDLRQVSQAHFPATLSEVLAPRSLNRSDPRDKVAAPPSSTKPLAREIERPTPSRQTESAQKSFAPPLGSLKFFEDETKPDTVYTGRFECPQCRRELRIRVDRNTAAHTPRQPTFFVYLAGAPESQGPIGRFHIAQHHKSPVLYLGTLHHCGVDQLVVVFFNRLLRHSYDYHLLMHASTSAQDLAADAGDVFTLH